LDAKKFNEQKDTEIIKLKEFLESLKKEREEKKVALEKR
jgi:hypothetical protein